MDFLTRTRSLAGGKYVGIQLRRSQLAFNVQQKTQLSITQQNFCDLMDSLTFESLQLRHAFPVP